MDVGFTRFYIVCTPVAGVDRYLLRSSAEQVRRVLAAHVPPHHPPVGAVRRLMGHETAEVEGAAEGVHAENHRDEVPLGQGAPFHLKICSILTKLLDPASELVPRDHRERDPHFATIQVDIGTANAAELHPHQEGTLPDVRPRIIMGRESSDTLKNHGLDRVEQLQ